MDRLELMATENLSVAAAFNLSYEDLTPEQQRLFRRLGLHPGTDIDGYAAAALDGTGLAAARRGLEALYDQYLLTEPAQGRYRLHDLIRQAAPGWLLPLSPTNGGSMRARRGHQARRSLTSRPEDTWACGPSRISAGSCDPALVGSPATRITYLTRARAHAHGRQSGRWCISAAVCVVTGPWLLEQRRVR